jgi:hypothetical protein
MHEIRLDPDMPPPRYTDFAIRKWRPLHATFALQARSQPVSPAEPLS